MLAKITSGATGIPTDALIEAQGQRVAAFDLLFLMVAKGELVGYGGYGLFQHSLGTVIYESAKMITKDYQRKGLGTIITTTAVHNAPTDFFVFRTQNPAETRSVENSLPYNSLIAPIGISYDEDQELQQIMLFTAEKLGISNVEPTTGRCPGLYGGKFGDYVLNREDLNIQRIEKIYHHKTFDRNVGDTVFHTTRI